MKNVAIITILLGFAFNISAQDSSYELLYLQGDYEQIKSISKKKETPADYFWEAIIIDKEGYNSKSLEIIQQGLEIFPDDSVLQNSQIDLLFKNNRYASLLPLLTPRLDSKDHFLKYIHILEFNEEWTKAIKILEDRIVTDSINTELLSHLGDDYLKADRILSAIHTYRKIYTKHPEDMLTAFKLAKTLLKIKMPAEQSEAIKICDKALEQDPTSKRFLKTRGIAYFNLQNYEEANISFNQLYHLGDTSQFALKHLGICEFQLKKHKTATKHLLLAFKKDSADFEVSFMLGRCFLNSTTPENGLFFLNHADSLLQPSAELMAALYMDKQSIYSAIDNHEEALNCYFTAYEYDPKPKFLYFIASKYMYGLEDHKKALDYYQQFLNALPPKPESEHEITEKQATLSMRKIAEDQVEKLNEELFFKMSPE